MDKVLIYLLLALAAIALAVVVIKLCYVVAPIGKVYVIVGNHKPRILFAKGAFYNPIFSKISKLDVTDISDVLLTKLNSDEKLTSEEIFSLMLLTQKVTRQ